MLENADTDAGTFLRARALAHEVFWRPVDAAGIGGVFEDLRSARVPLWDLPARGDDAVATTFWTDSSLDQEHWSGVPFLRTSEGARPTAVMTEDACFLVSRKALRRVFTLVPWKQVRFTVSVIPGEDIVFYVNGKKLGTLFPDWDVVGVVNPDLSLRLEAFMNGLGQRVRAFTMSKGVCRRGQQISLVRPGSRPLAQLARGGTNWERNSVTRLRVSDEGLYSDAVVRFRKLDTNNWKPLLAFRKRLIAGEVAPELSTASVASTGQVSEITKADGTRNMACRPISTTKKQQILDLARTSVPVSQIAAEVGVAETTVRATCRQATRPPRRRRRFTSDDLQRAQQLHAQGRTYIEIGLELGFGRDTVKKHLATGQG